MATIVYKNDKFVIIIDLQENLKVIVVTTIILKCTWKARYDAIFNQILVNLHCIITLAETNLKMELNWLTPSIDLEIGTTT